MEEDILPSSCVRLVRNECTPLSACGEIPYIVFHFEVAIP